MISKTEMAKIAKLLGFEVYHESPKNESFYRKGELERTHLYLYTEGKNTEWVMSIHSNKSLEDQLEGQPNPDYYHSSKTHGLPVRTAEDILENMCQWYHNRGQAIVIAQTIDITRRSQDEIDRLKYNMRNR